MKQPQDRRGWLSIRVIAGTCILAFCMVWTAAMVTSAWYWFGYTRGGWCVDFGDGTLYVNASRSNRAGVNIGGVEYSAWTFRSNGNFNSWTEEGRTWAWTWWEWGADYAPASGCKMYSVWPMSVVSGVVGGWLLWPAVFGRRRGERDCKQCGYSLIGLGDVVTCPECGWETEGVSS
jgi:hypothetical protein